jgi:type II restriction/modification system DNA methylase subunit YeeA
VIFEAWDDEPWVVEGAAVRVSLVCFAPGGDPVTRIARLDGHAVAEIFSDLTARHDAAGVDLTKAARLPGNVGIAFMGDTKGGAFDISGDLAREWLCAPRNPNGRLNSDVLRPWVNGLDLTRRSRDMWIIDFGWTMNEADASLYEAPFSYAQHRIQVARVARQQRGYARHWWRHERPRPDMWAALSGLARYIATPTVAKHRLFVWVAPAVCPDHQLIVIARDDDTTLGIVHSRFHELWALRLGTWLGVGNDPRYTPSTTFETFPFPDGLTPDIPAEAYADDPRAQRIAAAARRLNELREAWLNPPDLVVRVPEVVPGYPDRILPKDEASAKELKKRTLTKLYNERPAWLDNVHKELDAAVASAYGWPAELSDDEILKRLLDLNQARAGTRPGVDVSHRAAAAHARHRKK